MNQRPRIGITTSRGGGRYMWWFYWLAMQMLRFKPVRLVAPVDPECLNTFDGFIIGGGDDISTELYQGMPTLDIRFDPERDMMELDVLEYAVPQGTPILGVCRGSQMINVFFGGNLHQNIREAYAGVPAMWSPLPRKTASFVKGTKLHRILLDGPVRINSLHNQSVDRLGKGLVISAYDEYGIVQAIEEPQAEFLLGVQWHPEFLIYQASQRRIFRTFGKAVKRRLRKL